VAHIHSTLHAPDITLATRSVGKPRSGEEIGGSNASEARRDAGVSVAGAAGGCEEPDGNMLGRELGCSCHVNPVWVIMIGGIFVLTIDDCDWSFCDCAKLIRVTQHFLNMPPSRTNAHRLSYREGAAAAYQEPPNPHV
jgi:hypothetical protein